MDVQGKLPSPADRASEPYQTWRVDKKKRAPLIEFIEDALEESGCTLLHRSEDGVAPFRFTYITPWGERQGILAYAFFANDTKIKNRPEDEHRFQLKYGSKPKGPEGDKIYELWQDPFDIYTTLLIGINPERGFFVGADPLLNKFTRLFISKEFKEHHAAKILEEGWHAWERRQLPKKHAEETQSTETLVGGTAKNFLKYVLFERSVVGEAPGPRHLVADQFAQAPLYDGDDVSSSQLSQELPVIAASRIHALEEEFEIGREEILHIIAEAPRLKMAVRGWVAERHLFALLKTLPIVDTVETIEIDGQPDFRVRVYGGKRDVLVECKNVLRIANKHGHAKLDFQRTRAPKDNACGRYYSATEFHLVAACLHAQTKVWEFQGCLTSKMQPHKTCADRLAQTVYIDSAWSSDLSALLEAAAS